MKPPAAPSVPGTVETIAVLIVALGLAGLGRSWRRDHRSALVVAAGSLLLGFVIETTPHLVHHSLDPDQGASCEVLQTAERSQAVVVALDSVPVSAPAYLGDRSPHVPAPTLFAPVPCGRAPPA